LPKRAKNRNATGESSNLGIIDPYNHTPVEMGEEIVERREVGPDDPVERPGPGDVRVVQRHSTCTSSVSTPLQESGWMKAIRQPWPPALVDQAHSGGPKPGQRGRESSLSASVARKSSSRSCTPLSGASST